MKALIAIFFALVGVYLFMELVGFYNRTAGPDGGPVPGYVAPPSDASPAAVTGDSLPGLPQALESSLAQAQQQGAEELGKWLKAWSKQVQDPRLAWIELDYVVLLNLKDHKAARERFLHVKSRIPPGSPVYDRILKLDSAYEQ
ncbi:MAG: hypothetical protein JNL97_01100 [Verrucomicrobiales bacterium]|nr:hypothetical protein [Verrucomicrobiales bacterium]